MVAAWVGSREEASTAAATTAAAGKSATAAAATVTADQAAPEREAARTVAAARGAVQWEVESRVADPGAAEGTKASAHLAGTKAAAHPVASWATVVAHEAAMRAAVMRGLAGKEGSKVAEDPAASMEVGMLAGWPAAAAAGAVEWPAVVATPAASKAVIEAPAEVGTVVVGLVVARVV